MNLIEVRNLNKSFDQGLLRGSVQVLHSLSFKVKSDRVTGFVGANGSGKTTSLKCILDFVRPNSGEIIFFEGEKISSQVKSQLGFLPERPYLQDFLTAEEFLRLHWELSGGGSGFEKQAQRVLEKVQLSNVKNKVLRSFSKGMLQRIGVAQALLRSPQLIILDEPMSGLDPDGRLLLKDILRELKLHKTSVFFSSHLLADVEELCDDLVILFGGRLLYEGSLVDLQSQFPSLRLEEIYRQLVFLQKAKPL